jgi:hypothetical protein
MNALYRRGVAWAVAATAAGVAAVFACGPFFTDLLTVKHGAPVDRGRYARGELGVVKPTFARLYLVGAYRTMTGVGPLPASLPEPPATDDPALPRWIRIQQRVLAQPAGSVAVGVQTDRVGADYSSFPNCLESGFQSAVTAYTDRVARYGPGGPEIVNWVSAQAAVFQNCGGGALVLPPPPVPGADARLIADRDYQTASAYFYATQYDEAAGRFRAIASHAASPWRPFGRYLAARSLIRSVTVPPMPVKDAPQRLAAAERDLQAVLADKEAAPLYASARGLLNLIAARARPIARLHELSERLRTAATVAPQDLADYTRLMDIAFGEIGAGTPLDLAEVTRGDDLSDWIVATQRGGPRAVERWRDTRSEPWLVAALWTVEGQDAQAPALLAAAAEVPRTSPAYATAAVLRVRLLIQRNDLRAARTVLADLPAAPVAGMDAETINLLRAARFTVAMTLDDMLAAAPRLVVSAELDRTSQPLEKFTKPVWDDDVAATFNTRMPLDQLAAAAESTRLPPRLRLRVAQAAFTRAALLDRPQPAARAAQVLSALAPALRVDLARYMSATGDEARRRIATLTLLRTPGLSINVAGQDDDSSYERDAPLRRFGHGFPTNWWCGIQAPTASATAALITTNSVPFPPFVSEAGRRDTAAELDALKAIGTPREHLAASALAWAQARRGDPEAAEALALAIEGWRWSPCSYDAPKSDLPRRAFTVLHRQFPDSEWATKTKYWYE